MKIIQTRGHLAEKYGLCRQTVSKLLKLCGIHHRHHLTPADLDLFVQTIGTPESLQRTRELLSDRI